MKINRFYQANPLTPDQQKELQEKQMKQAAQAYEKYFLDEMVKAMRTTVPKGEGMIKPNFAEDLYRDNLDQEYVKGWVESGGVGLSDLIYEQIKSQIERVQGGGKPLETGPLPIEKGMKAYGKQAAQMKPLDSPLDDGEEPGL